MFRKFGNPECVFNFMKPMNILSTSLAIWIFCAAVASAQHARRLEVLFLGDDGHHQPIERYRVLKQAVGPRGVNLTYFENLAGLTPEKLRHYDALLVYANHEKAEVPPAILPWVRDGGALIALHSACGNFHPSKEWFDLVGGRFVSHEGRVFSPQTVDTEHVITKDLPVLSCWDETYVHRDLTPDRHLLQIRNPMNKGETEAQPWTWTRTEGKGRVFYTASGHDLRCWNEPAFQILVERAIIWAIGEDQVSQSIYGKLPPLEIEVPQIENRAHPDIPMMPLQKPLSPGDSAKHAQVPVGTRLMLFASEPMVINPISIDWDERGRAWVVESFGYPNDVPKEPGSGADRIKILEDRDQDGKADKVTVFADKLRHCTTTVFANGGIIATDGEDIVFLKDENRDDVADTRTVLASGLNMYDTHASASHFTYGMDHWIYATVGYSGIDMNIGDETHKLGKSVFRFRPDLSTLELLQNTTNNTWGLGLTEEGDVMGSTANNHPSWVLSIPARAYAGSGLKQPFTPRADHSTVIYPITRDMTQVDQIERYTAAAGHAFYTDHVLENFNSSHAFVCEPTGHIVGLGEVASSGSLFTTKFRGNNLYASSDAWSAPVVARTGPDGAVWIADWYNPIIQHNVVFRFWNPARGYDYPHSPYHTGAKKPGAGNAYVTPLRDKAHGRIWRVVPDDISLLRRNDVLEPRNTASLIEGLHSPSQHTRLHAQRLMVEHADPRAIDALGRMIAEAGQGDNGKRPLPAVHAIWAIERLGAAPGSKGHVILTKALQGENALLRRHALAALGPADPSVIATLPELIGRAGTARDQLLTLTIAAQSASMEPLSRALLRFASDEIKDEHVREATRLAMRRQGISILSAAMKEELVDSWYVVELLEIAKQLAAGPERSALDLLLATSSADWKARMKPVLTGAHVAAAPVAELPKHLMAGRDLYMKACIECHQADGNGVTGTFPPLVGSEWVTGDRKTLLRILLGGLQGPIKVKGVDYNSVMPGHAHVSDEDLAAIASYVRFMFGAVREAAVRPDEVKALRPEVVERKYAPWKADEIR
jgi:putative membrane-bound dehydrogenase-like protein